VEARGRKSTVRFICGDPTTLAWRVVCAPAWGCHELGGLRGTAVMAGRWVARVPASRA